MAANPGRVITSEVIASLLGKAWPSSPTPLNITAGFRKSGAFPLSPGEVTDRHLAPSRGLYQPQLSEKSPDNQCSTSSPASTDVSSFSLSFAASMSPRSFTLEQHKL